MAGVEIELGCKFVVEKKIERLVFQPVADQLLTFIEFELAGEHLVNKKFIKKRNYICN